MSLLPVLTLFSLALGLLLVLSQRRQLQQLDHLGKDIAAATVRAKELERAILHRRRLASAHRAGEDAFDDTTRAVQGLHRGIAAIPFGVLEAIPATRDTTRIVREVHDLTSNTVYGSLRGVNRLLGITVRAGLGVDSAQKDTGHRDTASDHHNGTNPPRPKK